MTDKEKLEAIKAEIERLKESGCASPIVICDTLLAFIDSLQKEPVNDDLEEAAIMHYKDVMEYEAKTGLKPAYMTSFKAGAKWQKNQLLKDALECPLVEHPDGYVFFDFRMSYPKDKYKAGDKVKIVVIKEEDKYKE